MDGGRLTHIGGDGAAAMVDVSGKAVVDREATAAGFIRLQEETLRLIRDDGISKGSVFGVARVAAIQAAKQTQNLIPLCHQIPLHRVGVDFEYAEGGVVIRCRVATQARTGVEMEALTGVSVAALTIYDMCKVVDKTMVIEGIHLVEKKKGDP